MARIAVSAVNAMMAERPGTTLEAALDVFEVFASGSLSDEIYILDLASGERIRLTKDGGFEPRWRGDARELFCISSQHVLEAIFKA